MKYGWYTTNPDVGVPFGLHFHDYPVAEGLHFIIFRLLGLTGLNVVQAINLYYIVGYALISCTSLFLFRSLGFPTLPAISFSLLLAFLPQHYMPGEKHLFLSSYYLVPLMCLVLIRLAANEPLIEYRAISRLRFALTGKGWFAIAVCVLIGSAGVYYAFFSVLFAIVAGVYAAVIEKSWRASLQSLIVPALVSVSLLLNFAPNLVYRHRYGPNPAVAHRYFVESHVYALKITSLLLPIPIHRIRNWGNLKGRYDAELLAAAVPNTDMTTALGVVLGAGFLVLIARSLFPIPFLDADRVLLGASALNLAAVLVSGIGGFGGLFALLVPEIRVYSRISVYIAIFSAIGLQAILQRLGSTPWLRERQTWFLLLCAGIVAGGLFDLTPAKWRDGDEIARTFQSDAAFIRQIDAILPIGAMVFQLPYHSFPEAGNTVKMYDYDHLRGYLHSDRLRWSYPAIAGRHESAWQEHVAKLPLVEMLKELNEAGFQGIYVDKFGYKDNAVSLATDLAKVLRTTRVEDSTHRFLFYPLSKTGIVEQKMTNSIDLRISLTADDGRSLKAGFLPVEGDVAWATKTAVLRFHPGPVNQKGSYTLSITGTMLSGRPVGVSLNKNHIGVIKGEGYQHTTTFEVRGVLLIDGEENVITLEIPNAGPMRDDPRTLGFSFKTAEIAPRKDAIVDENQLGHGHVRGRNTRTAPR
jgi:phosphoglycerol transferase